MGKTLTDRKLTTFDIQISNLYLRERKKKQSFSFFLNYWFTEKQDTRNNSSFLKFKSVHFKAVAKSTGVSFLSRR